MFPNGTLVEVVADNYFGWEAQYRAFRDGEKRLYKVIRHVPGHENRWGPEEGVYTCIMVKDNGKQRGSWHYRMHESELRPVISTPVNLEDYM